MELHMSSMVICLCAPNKEMKVVKSSERRFITQHRTHHGKAKVNTSVHLWGTGMSFRFK
jgi:hypothetical protein